MIEPRFLCLAHDFPLPIDDGSKRRIVSMLEILGDWGPTRVAVSPNGHTTAAAVSELEKRCGVEVLVGARPAFAPIPKHRLWPLAVTRRTPPWFLLGYDPAMPVTARRQLGWATHLVVLDDFAAQYLPAIGRAGVPVVLDKHQVYAAPLALGQRPGGPAGRARRVVVDRLVRANEARALRHADTVIVTSDDEARRLATILGRRADAVIESAIEQDLVWSVETAEPGHVLWMGSIDSRPNRQGLDGLIDHLDARFGAAWPFRLVVAGRGADDALHRRVAGRPVDVLGFVDDLDAVVRRSAAAVIPLSAGGGVRLKTLQLLGAGIPVVATATALEGVGAVDGVHCRVAPSVAELVDATVDVVADLVAAAPMGERAHELVAADHGWQARRPLLRAALGLP